MKLLGVLLLMSASFGAFLGFIANDDVLNKMILGMSPAEKDLSALNVELRKFMRLTCICDAALGASMIYTGSSMILLIFLPYMVFEFYCTTKIMKEYGVSK